MYALTRYRIQILKVSFIVFAPFRFLARGRGRAPTYGSTLLPFRFRVTVPPRAKTKGRDNELKVRENAETKGRENEKTRKRGNEKTKLRNLNPLPLQSIHFVIACISFCFLALFWEITQKWPTILQDN